MIDKILESTNPAPDYKLVHQVDIPDTVHYLQQIEDLKLEASRLRSDLQNKNDQIRDLNKRLQLYEKAIPDPKIQVETHNVWPRIRVIIPPAATGIDAYIQIDWSPNDTRRYGFRDAVDGMVKSEILKEV